MVLHHPLLFRGRSEPFQALPHFMCPLYGQYLFSTARQASTKLQTSSTVHLLTSLEAVASSLSTKSLPRCHLGSGL